MEPTLETKLTNILEERERLKVLISKLEKQLLANTEEIRKLKRQLEDLNQKMLDS